MGRVSYILSDHNTRLYAALLVLACASYAAFPLINRETLYLYENGEIIQATVKESRSIFGVNEYKANEYVYYEFRIGESRFEGQARTRMPSPETIPVLWDPETRLHMYLYTAFGIHAINSYLRWIIAPFVLLLTLRVTKLIYMSQEAKN